MILVNGTIDSQFLSNTLGGGGARCVATLDICWSTYLYTLLQQQQVILDLSGLVKKIKRNNFD